MVNNTIALNKSIEEKRLFPQVSITDINIRMYLETCISEFDAEIKMGMLKDVGKYIRTDLEKNVLYLISGARLNINYYQLLFLETFHQIKNLLKSIFHSNKDGYNVRQLLTLSEKLITLNGDINQRMGILDNHIKYSKNSDIIYMASNIIEALELIREYSINAQKFRKNNNIKKMILELAKIIIISLRIDKILDYTEKHEREKILKQIDLLNSEIIYMVNSCE